MLNGGNLLLLGLLTCLHSAPHLLHNRVEVLVSSVSQDANSHPHCTFPTLLGVRQIGCGSGPQTDLLLQHPRLCQHLPDVHQQIW